MLLCSRVAALDKEPAFREAEHALEVDLRTMPVLSQRAMFLAGLNSYLYSAQSRHWCSRNDY